MSLWSRIANVFRGDRLSREIDEELASHIAEGVEQGREPAEARRAFGPSLRLSEESRDLRLIPWLDSLRADAVFGWRQLLKRKATSVAAILSLALAIGACTSAFRLLDAMLLRPLPIAAPERLYILSRQSIGPDGKLYTNDNSAYPMFRQMRSLVKDQAELIAISPAARIDLTFGSDQDTENAYQQYVSGWMFGAFGLRPALGRVLTENDDLTPGAHPYAVISYDYWTRHFGRDASVIGRSYRTGEDVYQVVGVAPEGFIGTEPGGMTDIFIPTMMAKHDAITRSDYRWFRTFVQLKPGVALAPVREKLRASFRSFLEESVKAFGGAPRQEIEGYLSQKLMMEPSAAGVSGLQKMYGIPLIVLGALVALVLFIAAANVANLMAAQTAARQREMALRVSIGAGRWRLVQLLLAESAWTAFLAAGIGTCFAWWSAPFVIGMISAAGNPVRLALPMNWRVLGFGLAVTLGVTFLVGLGPALRAAAAKPASALKGGDDPHGRARLMHTLIALQVAFCFLVVFVAGLFVATSARLSRQHLGFADDRLLAVETLTSRPQPAALWEQVAEHLRTAPGVGAVALCEWPLMAGESWNGFISVNGAAPNSLASYFLSVSDGWRDIMKIALIGGRDFRASDRLPGSVMVNQTFARQYFAGENPVGKSFEVVANEGQRTRYEIVGLVGDARYQDMRGPIQPVAYFPFRADYGRATFMVRSSGSNPLPLASLVRREISQARPGFHVSTIRTETALVEQHTVRERLLAILAGFFAAVALLLAGIGLYGVLNYSVLQRQREIGIRMAIGAQPADIARRVGADILAMIVTGSLLGVTLGVASVRYIEALLYGVKATDVGFLALPPLAILAVAILAALPAVIRAVRIDPVSALRSE